VPEVPVYVSKRHEAAKNRNILFCGIPSDGKSDSTFSAAFGFTVVQVMNAENTSSFVPPCSESQLKEATKLT